MPTKRPAPQPQQQAAPTRPSGCHERRGPGAANWSGRPRMQRGPAAGDLPALSRGAQDPARLRRREARDTQSHRWSRSGVPRRRTRSAGSSSWPRGRGCCATGATWARRALPALPQGLRGGIFFDGRKCTAMTTREHVPPDTPPDDRELIERVFPQRPTPRHCGAATDSLAASAARASRRRSTVRPRRPPQSPARATPAVARADGGVRPTTPACGEPMDCWRGAR